MNVFFRLVSPLERVFPQAAAPEREYRRGSALRGEVFALQAAWCVSEPWRDVRLRAESALGELRLRTVESMPVRRAGDDPADGTPGLYPELLIEEAPELLSSPGVWRSGWISVEIPADAPAGEAEIIAILTVGRREYRRSFRLTVLNAALPASALRHTEWLHVDSLCDYYRLEPWSEACWRVTEAFLRDQARHDVNMVLTPILTPALDTAEGTCRRDVQLVGITEKAGRYRFDFSRLDRWVETARACGMTGFEIPPLFSQWGARCAAPVVVNGALRFGWHTPAEDREYAAFLAQFLAALRGYRAAEGWAESCYWHVSDEPGRRDRKQYRRAVGIFRAAGGAGLRHLEAVSRQESIAICDIDVPVVSPDAAAVTAGEGERWWYCSSGDQKGLTNRLVHFDPARNRWIGFWMYRERVAGFLHWGHNFYRTRLSRRAIDPYCEMEAGGTYPAGDAFWVYPGADGSPVASMRYEIFHQGLQDLRAAGLLESLAGRPATERMLARLDRNRPLTGAGLLALREAVNRAIAARV